MRTDVNFIVRFVSPVFSRIFLEELQNFFSRVGVVRNNFLLGYIYIVKQSHRSLQYDAKNLDTKFCYSNFPCITSQVLVIHEKERISQGMILALFNNAQIIILR